MIKEKFGARLDRVIRTLLPLPVVRRLSPNVLTVLGALVSLGAAVTFGMGHLRWGGALILAGGFFDLVDGAVARETGRSSTFGAFLDATLDRFSDLAVLAGIVVYYAGAGAPAVALIAGWALVASALVSYSKARAESVMKLEAGLFERGERTVLLALGALAGLLPWALAVLAVGATLTVGQRMALAYREMEKIDAGEIQKLEAAPSRLSEGHS